jgi:hypothetical protein
MAMGESIRPPVLTEERLRELVNRWNDQGWLRIKNLGDKIFVDEIAPRTSCKMRLRSQYEDRAVSEASVPYSGGPIDDHGPPPDPWDLPVRRPTDFEERSETQPRPHTERVTVCASCAGFGRVACSSCNSTGRVNCPSCQGKSYRERQEMRPDPAKGQGATTPVTVQEPCSCHMGQVTCKSCSGHGQITCPTCGGACRTKQFEQVTIAFRSATEHDLIDPTDIPDHLVGASKGEIVAERRAPRLDEPPPVTGDVDQRVRALLKKSHDIDERKTRLLFQHVQVQQIDIQEVRYRYASKSLRLWVYGSDAQVYAPGVPWHWQKLLWIPAGIVGVIAIVGLLVLLTAAR